MILYGERELVSGTKGRAGLIIHESSAWDAAAGAMQRRSICLYTLRAHLLLCHGIISGQLMRMLRAICTLDFRELPLTRCCCAFHIKWKNNKKAV
jgi:hypothetical protein